MMHKVQVTLAAQEYGKMNVRLIKVATLPPSPDAPGLTRHSCVEYTAQVLLRGDAFTASYATADNRMVVATDTVKNTIYAWARRTSQPSLETPELFAREIAVHFLREVDHVDGVNVALVQHRWSRIPTTTLEAVDAAKGAAGTRAGSGAPASFAHPHSFYRDGDEKRVAHVLAERVRRGSSFDISYQVRSGLTDLLVLKTTGSSFEHFHKTQYRTLADSADRLLSTSVDALYALRPVVETPAEWQRSSTDKTGTPFTSRPYDHMFTTVRQIVLDLFANHNSPSVQHTLYLMARQALALLPDLDSVVVRLPNKHSFPVDMTAFGLSNAGRVGTGGAQVFQPISEPSGLITATVSRSSSAKL